MSLREWLIAIGTLIIIVIVVDGIRRMRRARKESLAISSGMGADDLKDSPLDDDYNPELPNGGARIISRGAEEEQGQEQEQGILRPGTEQGFGSSDEGEVVPESGWGAKDEVSDGFDEVSARDVSAPDITAGEPQEKSDRVSVDAEPAVKGETQESPVLAASVQGDTARRAGTMRSSSQPPAGANRPEASEVLVINVLARSGEQFQGTTLKSLFEACGLELGDMDIYHRHEAADTTSPVQFSVANAVQPGTFRPQDMAALSTPGISFFMSLPGPDNAMQAFDFMLETAQCVVRNMGGELKDERRSVMTPQTVEHCRQRIREFERKQRSRRV